MRVRKMIAAALLLILATALPPALGEEAAVSTQEARESFFGAFTLVPENPLPGDLPYLLRLISLEPPEETAKPALSPLAEAAAKFAALISGAGAHYEESTAFMGMDMKAEYWMKGEKIKKHDKMLDEFILFDGEWFYQWPAGEKAGTRMTPDSPQAQSAIMMIKSSSLSALANAPYQQQEDAKEGKYNCQVFYMDIEFMGMKGNWLYVDKETGALVKNQYGKGKDGMSVTLTMLDTGGVADDAFLPPEGVSFTGP